MLEVVVTEESAMCGDSGACLYEDVQILRTSIFLL